MIYDLNEKKINDEFHVNVFKKKTKKYWKIVF